MEKWNKNKPAKTELRKTQAPQQAAALPINVEKAEAVLQTPRHSLNLLTFLFAGTLFLSAALLFIVEPMFAKMVLPQFGGAPAVWNTCLVFYQAILLGGYLYAHLSMKWLSPRRQAVLHLAVLLVPWIVLPIRINDNWLPPADAFPVPWVWLMLTLSVGLPFFVISASAPVLQAWFSETRSRSAKDPYFLYAASNLGSLLALLSYPLLIEASLTLTTQTLAWTVGYGFLMVLIGACAIRMWRTASTPAASSSTRPSAETVSQKADPTDDDAQPLGVLRRLRWVLLSAIPSSLLLGVTSHLTVDIVSMPLLWVVPLALYLLTFVIVFSRKPILSHRWMVRLQPFILVVAAASFIGKPNLPTAILMLGSLHLLAFFLTAMVCHGELAADRPSAKRLTEFYLWMSFGGVLGGLFNTLAAPLVFNTVLEYPLVIAAACLVRPHLPAKRPGSPYRELVLPGVLLAMAAAIWLIRTTGIFAGWRYAEMPAAMLVAVGLAACSAFMLRRRPAPFGLSVAALAALSLWCAEPATKLLHVTRSFFGVMRVEYDSRSNTNILVHGLTHHGQQSLDAKRRREPLAYFHKQGPLGTVFQSLESRRPLAEIGVLGLGAGTIAAYGRPGERMTFYEIDPAVERIARDPKFFTYLSDCPAKIDVILGDARLSLAQGTPRKFDLLIIDVFNSDAVPLHLVTREAFAVYLHNLSEHGVLAAHISSRYLNLEPVLSRLAADTGLVARICRDDQKASTTASDKSASDWVVMARHLDDLGSLKSDSRWLPLEFGKGRLWTDDFSNLVDAIQLDRSWSWLQPSSWTRSSTAVDQAAMATALAREGRLKEAVEQFEKALEIDPQFAEAHGNLGAALAKLGRFDEALKHYETALKLEPNAADIHDNAGITLLSMNRAQEAIGFFKNAIAIDPQFAEAHAHLGAALTRLERFEEALGYFKKALDLQPDRAETHNDMAIALARLGKLDEATVHWQRAVELNPQLADAHFRLGMSAYVQGRVPQAVAIWRKGIAQCPDQMSMLYRTAKELATNADASVRNGSEAVKLAVRAAEISRGEDPTVLDILAAAYAESGRYEDAIATIDRAIAIATAQKASALVAEFQAKLKLYQAGTPFHEKPNAPPPRMKLQ